MMGRSWKYWDGSIRSHLWNKTSVKLYLLQGIGTFLICVLLYPPSRFIGAVTLAAGFVVVGIVAQVIHLRWLRRRKAREGEEHPNQDADSRNAP